MQATPRKISPLVLALVALAVLLVAIEAARPCFFLHDDNATWFAGAFAHDFRTLTETGRLAQVNFYQYGGEPFLEQGQTAVLYPPVYLGEALAWLVPGDLRWAIEWIAAIHLALAVAGFYAWARLSGIEARLAALGGLAWALNPFVLILGASWITVTFAAAGLPWLFWGIDRVFALGTRGSGVVLGVIGGLFVLQGYVQWAAYAFLFAGVYVAYLAFSVRRASPSPAHGVRGLPFAALVAVVISLPLVMPMAHAMGESKVRAQALSLEQELFYHVELPDLLAAQVGFFRAHFLFDASMVLFFCPALMLVPIALGRFVRDAEARARLFPLLVLAGMALLLSTRWYFLLNVVPGMQHFRWPFKVFLFVEFFLVAGLVFALGSPRPPGAGWDASSDSNRPSESERFPSPSPGGRRLPLSFSALLAVIALQVVVALANHDANFLSRAVLPTSESPLPTSVDLTRGRVVAIDDHVPAGEAWRFMMYAYGTYYEVPSLGGYNPLVSGERLDFALGLDVPNFYDRPVTPEIRAALESRGVRYWMVDPNSSRRAEIEMLDGMRLLDATGEARYVAPSGLGSSLGQTQGVALGYLISPLWGSQTVQQSSTPPLIFEDLRAQPMAFDVAAPTQSLPIHYSGNSLFVQLNQCSQVAVSLGPTDGWRFRVDGGAWQKPEYHDFRIFMPVSKEARQIEIIYVDAWFNTSCYISLIIMILAIAFAWPIRPRFAR